MRGRAGLPGFTREQGSEHLETASRARGSCFVTGVASWRETHGKQVCQLTAKGQCAHKFGRGALSLFSRVILVDINLAVHQVKSGLTPRGT